MAVTVDDVVQYMGAADATRWAVIVEDVVTYPEIVNALAAETAAQGLAVSYPEGGSADLDEALKRRVVRNLAMRSLPLAVMPANLDAGTGPVRIALLDGEVRRLERPYPRLPAG